MAVLDKAELRALKREHKHIPGNTRAIADVGTDEPARMRGVKEAVRHIMRDLK